MKLENRWHFGPVEPERIYVEIVSDAAISSVNIADGKTIPLVILNTENAPLVNQSISLHKGIERGHANSIWGKSINNSYISLNIEIVDPCPVKFSIIFDPVKHAGLIDLIVYSQLLFVQPGKPGDRYKNTMDQNRIMIEIPSTSFALEWKKSYLNIFTKKFQNQGFKKKDARIAAMKMHEEWGKMKEFRIKEK